MLSAGKPENELERLKTLRECQVLDTDPEPVYDDITRLLSLTCDMPMAVVSLLDEERSWFKSKVGLDVDEVPREISPCAHAILHEDLFVVPDAQAHEAFHDNPLVTGGPGIRSFAATRIVMPDGHAIGVVAVMDVRPRELTRDQRETLLAMGRQVASHLELRRRMLENERDRQHLESVSERLDLVVEAACEGIWDLDLNLRSMYLSPRVFDMLGLSKTSGQVPLAGIWPLIHPEDRRATVRQIVRQLRNGRTIDCEFRCKHAVDGWRWYRARAITVGTGTRETRRLVGSLSDTDEHKKSQEHLQRVSRLLAESQALGRIGGWELDLATGELFWTAETYRIHDTSPSTYAPTLQSAMEFFTEDARREMRAAIEDAVARGRAFSIDVEMVTARNRTIWVRATGGAVFSAGAAIRVLGAIQDITSQKRFDEELLHAKEAAESASVAKSAFLAAMSHEIRTPMHTVLGYTDMLRDSDLEEEQRECVSVIASAGNSLLRLIDDILDFSKVEAGKMVLERTAFDVQRIVNDVARMMQPQANQKGVEVRVDLEGSVLQVVADPQRVHQILVNLAGNAVKFTSEGSVVISAGTRDGRVRIVVKDSGIGISEEGLAKLFGNFVQVDSSTRRKYGGTGLGLAISKQLVEAMGGTIGVDSEVGVGSEFWFELPVTGATDEELHGGGSEGSAPTVEDEDVIRGRRVLVAEDNRMNLRLAVRVLESFGLEVDTAVDGDRAATLVCENDYDVVLMDCLMPGVDGFEATRRIRTHEEQSGGHTPIIALTANALPEDRDTCLNAGMDDFVSKPFTRQALRQAILRWLTQETA